MPVCQKLLLRCTRWSNCGDERTKAGSRRRRPSKRASELRDATRGFWPPQQVVTKNLTADNDDPSVVR
jgi:hypothetical protein